MRTTSNFAPSSRPTGAGASALTTLWTRLAGAWGKIAVGAVARQAINRRVLHRLSLLTDHELSDIGLSRYDVAASALPENGDAMHYLVARQEERRRLGRGSSPF